MRRQAIKSGPGLAVAPAAGAAIGTTDPAACANGVRSPVFQHHADPALTRPAARAED